MIYLEITYAQKDEAKRFGVRWDSEIKACFFEKRPGQALPLELFIVALGKGTVEVVDLAKGERGSQMAKLLVYEVKQSPQ
jgi:hypothetical protein